MWASTIPLLSVVLLFILIIKIFSVAASWPVVIVTRGSGVKSYNLLGAEQHWRRVWCWTGCRWWYQGWVSRTRCYWYYWVCGHYCGVQWWQPLVNCKLIVIVDTCMQVLTAKFRTRTKHSWTSATHDCIHVVDDTWSWKLIHHHDQQTELNIRARAECTVIFLMQMNSSTLRP